MASVRNLLKSLRRSLAAYHPMLKSIPPSLRSEVYGRSAVSHANKYVYVRVPKAANSTISKTLAWMTYPEDRATIEQNDSGRTSKHLFDKYPMTWRSHASIPADYFTFMFVRNPYSRVLSAYLDKIDPASAKSSFSFVARDAGKSNEPFNFSDFVTYLERGGLHGNIHWAPQVDICPIPIDRLDLVAKIESISDGLAEVGRRVFSQPITDIQQRSSGRTNSTSRLQRYYTPELAERVATLYRRDFETFSYDPRELGAGDYSSKPV